MAVPTIPSAIALTDIQTTFGGSNPISINEYYSGGTYVPSGTANSTGTTIPTTGQIAFSNFSGAASGYPALVKAHSITRSGFTPSVTTTCRWVGTTAAANQWQSTLGTANIADYNWTTLPPTSGYDLRVTKTSSSPTSLSLTGITNNAWTVMSSNISVSVTRSVLGIGYVWATCAIKYNANSTIIDSNSCYWMAERKTNI